jgi:hypothetical protein
MPIKQVISLLRVSEVGNSMEGYCALGSFVMKSNIEP